MAGQEGVQLALPYELNPQNAPRFAEDIAAQARAHAIELDYSADSISYFDSVIESMRAASVEPQQVAEVLLGFGCYLGEAIIRSAGGKWVASVGTPGEKVAIFPILLHLPDGRLCDPAARGFLALQNGPAASFVSFYQQYTRS